MAGPSPVRGRAVDPSLQEGVGSEPFSPVRQRILNEELENPALPPRLRSLPGVWVA